MRFIGDAMMLPELDRRSAMRIFIGLALATGVATSLGRGLAAQAPVERAMQAGNSTLLAKKVLSLAAAHRMAEAAIKEAARNHWRGVVAVVDDGGWLILLERMGHSAMTASGDLAAGKARPAALVKKPSQDLEDAIDHGRYAAITAPGTVAIRGGLPVVIDGEVVGAIEASFAHPEQDIQVARAGLAALNP